MLVEIIQWDSWIVSKSTVRPMYSNKSKLISKIS